MPRIPSQHLARLLGLSLIVVAGCSGGVVDLSRRPPPADPDRPESWAPYYAAMAALGNGFVVWESFRAGHWRIWMRRLDGSPEHQLSPDEPGRDHVAAHIAPDGRHLVYLSLPAPHESFDLPPPGQTAPLHLVRLDGDQAVEDRILVPDAHPYHQSRVALWVNSRALVYIAGDNTTRQLDILTGAEEVLIPEPRSHFGMLVNGPRTHATNGVPTFSIYHPSDRTVSRRPRLPGCQPYFTADGSLGYWVASPGGPVRKYDLADYTTTLVIDRDSKWLPKGHGYLYYPMASADRGLLAFSASKNQHDHFAADFDVFVAPLDPERLEVTGTAVRYSFSPGQDRFPDVWRAGSELGLLAGEVPFRVRLHPDPDEPDGAWSFDFGDGTPATNTSEHLYGQPGLYRVTARRADRLLGGEVRVRAAAPPRVLHAEVLPGGREIAVLFDEPIDVRGATARLESGTKVAALRAGERGRDLVVSLAEPLLGTDVLRVEGVSDRAEEAHLVTPQVLSVGLAPWPGSGDGLVFVFATEGDERQARDLDTGHERVFPVVPHGRARYDANGALLVTGGWFEAEELPERLSAAFREAGAFTLEATVWPALEKTEDPARIISVAHDGNSQNLSLSQNGREAVLRVRLTQGGEKDQTTVEFGQLAPGVPNHLLVTYRSGQLVAYQDGRRVLDTDALQGDLSAWRDDIHLALGADPLAGGRDFAGRIEGVALYNRFFEPAEAASHANAYLHEIAQRDPVPRLSMNARLLAISVKPTPEQVAPYRDALVVNEYEVPPKKREELGTDRVRVAHWAVLDGQAQPVPSAPRVDRVALEIEPWESYPRLEGTYLSDTLDPNPEVPLYLDVGG